MAKVPKRDIGYLLHVVRNALLGRDHNLALRFEPECSARDQPPPTIPGGPAHELSNNWYVNRDPRRLVTPPLDLTQNLLPSGESGAAGAGTRVSSVPTPGKPYQWD